MSNIAVTIPAEGKVELQPCAMPTPQSGEVLVRTLYTLISGGTELTILGSPPSGAMWKRFMPPQLQVGYSHVGEVVEVGPEVDRSWIGRTVATKGAHAAYVSLVVRESEVRRSGIEPVPSGVDQRAATLGSLAAIAMNGVRRGQLTFGESVLVVGLGLLGQLSARFCAFAGARPIFGANRSPDRLRWLRGARPLLGSIAEKSAAVAEANHGQLIDLAIEASGDPSAITEALALLRPEGRLVVLGSPRGATSLDLHDLCNWPSATIIGAHMRSHPSVATPSNPWTLGRHVRLFLDLLATKDLAVDDLISHVIPADRAPEAYALLRERREPVMGVCLDWTQR
jgi:2-desacetyl-2-hydroxyethyl bacteriochlorophyllide A dehydrogenase